MTTTAGRVRERAIALTLSLAALALGLLAAPPARADHRLDLTVTKTAGGTVTGDAINCGTDCTGTYQHTRFCEPEPGYEHICEDFYEEATLTATPAPGYRFVGWSGDCSGTGACNLDMSVDRSVHAEFANSAPSITIDGRADGAWLRFTFTSAATVTDDSGIEGAVRFDLDQRNSFGSWVPAQQPVYDYSPNSSGSGYEATFSLNSAYPDHAQGARLRVSACDAADACTVVTHVYGVDRAQPTFTDIAGPSGTVGPGTKLWSFRAGDATSGLPASSPWCDVPGFAGQTCERDKEGNYEFRRTYTTSGTHTWRVNVWDNAGNSRTVTRSFTVDADPPETAINSGPADGSSSTSTTATFNFSSEAGAVFRCRIYSVSTAPAVFGDCSGPGASHATSGLPPGTYRFEVVARDAVGNTDPTPAGRTFTVEAPSTPGSGETGGSGSTGGSGETSTAGSAIATTTTTATSTTATTTTGTQAPAQTAPTPKTKPGKCAKLKGKKRAACVRKACGKLKKKSAKKYKACVKKVTRKA